MVHNKDEAFAHGAGSWDPGEETMGIYLAQVELLAV
jgi:hypothetical protein